MNSNKKLAKNMAYSILAGVFGSILLLGFLTTLASMGTVVKFIPWVIGFNSALTGYTLIDRCGCELNHKHRAAVMSGFLNALITYVAVGAAVFYLTDGGIFSLRYLPVYLMIGCVLGWLGALLAIKYLSLE